MLSITSLFFSSSLFNSFCWLSVFFSIFTSGSCCSWCFFRLLNFFFRLLLSALLNFLSILYYFCWLFFSCLFACCWFFNRLFLFVIFFLFGLYLLLFFFLLFFLPFGQESLILFCSLFVLGPPFLFASFI